MNKKIIALILSLVMLVSVSPVVAAENAPVKPTVEDLLNEYHQKVFEAQSAEGTDKATTYSRSSSSGSDSLMQETVNALNAAGYEAYNLTASNYDTLEAALKTDFASIGLDPNGSYIVAISGEDNGNSRNPNARVGMLPEQEIFDGGGSPNYFQYTYGNTTYYMRYVTVTSDTNTHLAQTNDAELLEGCTAQQKANALNSWITCLSLVPNLSVTTTILSVVLSAVPNAESTVPTSIDYRAYSVWTPTYIQVYDAVEQEWRFCTSFEYATRQYTIQYSFYDPSTNLYDYTIIDGNLPPVHSEHYNNRDYLKQVAAISFNSNMHPQDKVEKLQYIYTDSITQSARIVITHQRWDEYTGYEPA